MNTLNARNQEVGRALGGLGAKTPEVMKALTALHGAAAADGALSMKVKELMAVAVSVHAGCEDCIAFHLSRAQRAGASLDEIHETLGVAVMMGGGPASVYAARTAAALDDDESS